MRGGVKERIVSFFEQYVLDIIFPKYCLGCNKEGSYYCALCQQKGPLTWSGLCFGCRKISLSGRLCEVCQSSYYFDGVICAADYEDKVVSSLIQVLKYNFVKEIATNLGLLVAKALEEKINLASGPFKNNFFKASVIPVPLSKKRYHWRGFNQAEEISKSLANYFNLDLNNNLVRLKNVKPQAKLTEAKRLINMQNCFGVIGKVSERIILVDDVITTGATVNECAKILRTAGAKEIWVVVCAKG